MFMFITGRMTSSAALPPPLRSRRGCGKGLQVLRQLRDMFMRAQIDLNVWAHTLLLLAAPQWADPLPSTAPSGQQRRSAVIWLATTLAGAAFATAVAAAVPFFSTVMGLIAAVGDMSAAFILPALFCLRLVRHRMRAWEVWLCWALIPVATVLAVLGTWSSGLQLVLDLRHHHRKP